MVEIGKVNKTPRLLKKKHKGKKLQLTYSRTTKFGRTELANEVKQEVRLQTIGKTWKTFWKLVPRIIWTFYVEVFVVAAFRNEWAEKYREWNAWLELNHASNQIQPALLNTTVVGSSRKSTNSDHTALTRKNHLIPASHDHHNCSRIRLNVGGRIFETQLRTILRFPQTLLGDSERRLVYYDPAKQYYYFDRNRECFESILYYYQSGGRLICPTEVSADVFLNEIEFFDLGDDLIRNFQIDEGLDLEDENANIQLPKNLLQRKLWLLMEYPTSSAQATLVSIISVYVVLVSVVVFCIETETMFRERAGYWVKNKSVDDEEESTDITDPLQMVETICIVWFTTELILRFLLCPAKCTFLREVMNLVDILAVLPYIVSWSTKILTKQSKEATSLAVIRVIRLVRVFRIFKLSRHVKGLKILGWTLQASFNELGLLIFFLVIGIVLYSSAIYFAEEGPKSKFPSIPHAFFWAVTTMTTVGYGDMVPSQNWGKVIGSLCAITGVLTLALPVPVMVSNFNYFYNQDISRSKSISDRTDTHNVEMCCFLPGNGVHPDAKKSDFYRPRVKKQRVSFSENPYYPESEGSFSSRKDFEHLERN